MKKNGKNIITSDDVTVLGKNSGKRLHEVLENIQKDLDSLKSNVKWLYKYGGVGGNGGGEGSSTVTDKWTVVCSLGNIQIPETTENSENVKSILFSSAGTYKLYVHINNPGGDTYSVEYSYNGGKSTGKLTLNYENRWTSEVGLNLIENNTIHVSIMNGNMLEKTFDALHIINAYSIWSYLADNSGIQYETFTEAGVEKYNLFIDDIKLRGLKFVTKYNSSVNIPVTYYYTKFKSNEEIRETSLFSEGQHDEILLEVDAIDGLENMTDNDASPYTFFMKLNIDNGEMTRNISADFLPNDLYLKIIPVDTDLILYPDTTASDPQVIITGNKTFTITPYNGKTGGSGKINCTYFINDVQVMDSSTSLPAQDSITPGKAFQKTFVFTDEGWNKITFRAGSGDRYKEFIYYIYTEKPSNIVDWFDESKHPFSSAFYRYGDSSQNLVKLVKGGTIINPNTYITKNANDIILNEVIQSLEPTLQLELIINIGIQYNYINDESKEIIEIPTTDTSDTNSIHIYQNKILIGASEPLGIFFLEEEEKYDTSNKDNYHLITIARKYIRTSGISTHQYELSFYIDGVLQANTVLHVLPSTYDRFILKNGNYSINLLDITYFNNNNITETSVVQYWYAYQTRLQLNFDKIGLKTNLLNIFSKFNLEHIDDDPQKLLTGHVSIIESTLMDLVQNINVPILCIEYEPSANKDSLGNPMQFLTPPTENAAEGWSDTLYDPDSHNSLKLTIGIKWSNGTGTADTLLQTIDTSSVLTPDGQQRSARFTLDIQGSTTRSYKGKNYTLGIEFTDSSDLSYIPVFTPWFDMNDKNSFLPENSFTLKADIVDSSHTNNTCMGKFINENTVKFSDAQQTQSSYSGHIKNCLEGFPCLIFVHSSGDIKYYYLGIYNFNLGRTSNFNLGYSNLRSLPLLTSSSHKNFHIYSVSKTESEIKLGLITAEIDGNEAWYDFSQYDESILFQLPNRPNDEGYMFSEIVSGKDTSGNISQYTKSAISNFVKRASRSGGYVFDRIEKGFYDNIESNYTTLPGFVPNARTLYKRIKNDEVLTFEVIPERTFLPGSAQDFTPEDLINFIYSHTENDLENVAPYSNFQSIVEYYTVCMAFGLLDSVQKNLNIKSWNEGNTFYLAFYDMDTCLGINNDGKNVSYYAFSDYWKNSSGDIINYDDNQVPIILAPPITIYRDHAPKVADASLYDVPSSYVFAIAKYAKSVIEYYNLNSSESGISIETLTTPLNLWARWRSVQGELKNSKYFIDKYYNGYMEGINELMFNYNFKTKYFKESSESTYDQESSRFRGRSIGYLKDWLNKRFHILDAYFNLAANKEIYISDGDNYSKTLDPTSGYQIVYEQYPAGLITYSDDVNINKSIFGENSSISGDIDIVVQAPDYTPVIATVGRAMYRYLLEESSNKYNIKIRNNGTNKVIFGGSSMWTYIESIDSLAEGSVFIQSDKLQVLNGSNGTVNAWELNMPALQEVHLNSPNYAGNLTFDRNSNFYNLTTIDISNSKINLSLDNQVVRQINLTNINSGKIDIQNCHFIENILFNNSLIGECYINEVEYLNQGATLTLNGNSIRKLDITAKASLNLNLTINNDPSLTTLIVSGFKNVTVTNCPQLTSITSNGDNLIKLNVTNCLLVASASLNVTNCPYIQIDNASLSEFKLKSSTDFTKLTTLLIPNSKISKVQYYKILNGVETEVNATNNNIISFVPLVNLDNFNISRNSLVLYIIFPNDFSKPIPIRNTFEGCINLLRIYGCIKIVQTNNTFYNLQYFTVHGDLSSTWKGYSKTKSKTIGENQYSIVLTPMQLLSGEEEGDTHTEITTKYNAVTKQQLFLEGNNVTNIFFNSSISGSFSLFMLGTNINLFDVYYMLNSFGLSGVSTNNITLGNGAFYSLNTMFNYSEGNQFNRYTFYKCSKITYLSGSSNGTIFRTGTTLWYSPEVNGNTITNNGLFSPLTGLRTLCRFSGTPYLSRYIFRRSGTTTYPLTTITWQDIGLIYDNIDNYEILSLVPTLYNGSAHTIVEGEEDKLGNMTDFFLLTPSLLNITVTFNTPVINYDTLKFPNTIAQIYNAFRCSYGFGTFNWKRTFSEGSNYNALTTITNAFTLSDYLNSPVNFELSNTMFSNMPNLLHLGYSPDGSYHGGYTDNTADRISDLYNFTYGFRGNGFNKTLENGEFPYNITVPIRKIKNFCGIFAEIYNKTSAPNIIIEFPKNIFINNYDLENIAGLFENCHIPIVLTSEGFKNCRNLKNVSRLFFMSVGATNDVSVPRIIQNVSIPYRFFYTGETIGKNTYYGTNDINVMNADIEYMTDNSTGTQFIKDNSTKTEVPTKSPIKSIQFGTECFYGQDKMRYYVWDKQDFNIEDFPNNNYIPYAYYKVDNTWYTRPNDPKYTKRYDISSIYDGDPNNLESEAYCSDSDNVLGYFENTEKAAGIINYFCPPDLLYSFKNSDSTNINGMFKWCGEGDRSNYTPRNASNISIASCSNGRICPYLFDTLSNLKYLTEFFYNFKGLNSYKVSDKYYLIPPTLFAQAKKVERLANTFHGIYFDVNPDYSFLSRLVNPLDVRGIFACCKYQAAYNIANIFLLNTLNWASGAFCVRPITLTTSGYGVSAATGNVQANEPNYCNLTNNISSSKNAARNLTRYNTGYTYYRVAGSVTESVINLNGEYNLRDL